MQLNPYLTFTGQCEEAMNFYKDCLNGQIESISYFDSTQMPVPAGYEKKVMHSVLRFGNNVIMASDSMPEHNIKVGSNVNLSINFESVAEIESVFKKFSEGGKITMPLEDTFWGAKFGMLIDKYGVNWMFNCDLKK